ncbi:BatD family protein [uncultured Pseudoteredinibacter sp.]|uniref:BatD family protein n=1 Tax=uncultured Pseudoteredinibacter sp. TaxID=1641701 RepID=UPI002615CD34|nr:BatD family protein [uncultured Pseudoteredinibacter sp.]
MMSKQNNNGAASKYRKNKCIEKNPRLSLRAKALALLSLLVFSSASFALNITAKVDRNSIAMSETLTLTVAIDEQAAFSAPSFDELQQNFDILRQHKSNRYQSMNGKVSSITEWVLTLGPKREGQLIIPSFEYDGEFSDAIPITVSKQGNSSGVKRDIFLESTTDKNTAYVQEQIIYTQKLYSAVNISSFDPEPLQLDKAKVELLAQFDYQTRINGRPYVVVETRYAIYPQHSGKLTLPNLRWSIGVSGGRRNIFDPFNNSSGRIHRLQSDAIDLEIKASPEKSTDWLPAEQLTISQSWSSDPEQMQVGEPITRKIEITAKGLTAAQLPNIDMGEATELQGHIKTYPEQPQSEDEKDNSGITGTRRISTAIIASKAGPLTLPAIEIRWWNTARQQWQSAKLPAMDINVKASTANPSQTQDLEPSVASAVSSDSKELSGSALPEEEQANRNKLSQASSDTASTWIIFSLLSSILVIALALLSAKLWRDNKQLKQQFKLSQVKPSNERQNGASAETVIAEADAQTQFQSLQSYINDQKSQHSNFENYYAHSELQELFKNLEAQLYSAQAEAAQAIDQAALRRAISALEAQLNQEQQSDSALPPLYPH